MPGANLHVRVGVNTGEAVVELERSSEGAFLVVRAIVNTALALGYARAGRAFAWLRRHGRAVEIVGGGLLVLMGVLMITGEWTRMFVPLLRWYSRSGWPPV